MFAIIWNVIKAIDFQPFTERIRNIVVKVYSIYYMDKDSQLKIELVLRLNLVLSFKGVVFCKVYER